MAVIRKSSSPAPGKHESMDTTRFQSAAMELRAAKKEMSDFVKAHREVIEKYEDLKSEEASLIDKVKVLARELSTVGETKTLFDDELVCISVQGRGPKVTYNYINAKYSWPKELLEKATVVSLDPVRIKALLLAGDITPEMEQRVRIEEPQTPAVSVR